VGTAADLTDPLSTTGFQHNGLVLVKSSRSVRLEGLILDGVRPAAFVNLDIWNKVFDLIHGSVGVSALQSRGVEIVGCELKGFWTAVYLKDRNLDCASWMGGAGARPWSSCGTMGGHLVEANRIHGNTVGIYSESAWDLGSVFRDNLAWDNYTRARTQTGTSVYPPAVLASMDYGLLDGGFMRLKDNLFPAHVVTRNTIVDTGTATPYGWTMYNVTPNALWSDDLVEVRGTFQNLTSPKHVFATAAYPHLWNISVLGGQEMSMTVSGGDVVDSTIRWQSTTLKPRDTLDGKLEGGKAVSLPGEVYDTIINGIPTQKIRTRWVTIFYDTIRRDTSCANGCHLGASSAPTVPASSGWIAWDGILQAGDSVTLRLLTPDWKSNLERTVWNAAASDSTQPFRLREMDQSIAWQRKLVLSANARWGSQDPSHPNFLALDTTLAGTRRLLALGGSRLRVGAIGSDGRIGQEPIRLRARGHGRWDKQLGQLVLPVSISGRLAGVEKLVVRKAWIAARPFDLSAAQINTMKFAERRVHPASLPAFAPTDTVLRIPFVDAGRDSLYQVDLWLAGVVGTDTLDATPMAWSIATVMRGSQTVGQPVRPATQASWYQRGHTLVLFSPNMPAHLEFLDVRGSRVSLPVVERAGMGTVDLSLLPAGLWIPRLTGARPVVAGSVAGD
jgi:hypothetical protein